MTDIKAVLCLDIDGTLTDEKEQIHPSDRHILAHFPGAIQPLFTTGRNLHSAKGVLQANGIFKQQPLPLPGVFMNGGLAYLPNEIKTIEHIFQRQTRKALLDCTSAFPQTSFAFFSVSEVYLLNPNPFAQHISRIHYLDAQDAAIDAIPDEVIKVMIIEQDDSKIEGIQSALEPLNAEKAFSLSYLYEINPPGVTKANTLKAFLVKLGLDGLPVYAAGDGQNDLTLFNLAQHRFAPDTAHPAVLAKADEVIQRRQEGMLAPILSYLGI